IAHEMHFAIHALSTTSMSYLISRAPDCTPSDHDGSFGLTNSTPIHGTERISLMLRTPSMVSTCRNRSSSPCRFTGQISARSEYSGLVNPQNHAAGILPFPRTPIGWGYFAPFRLGYREARTAASACSLFSMAG